ncbi:MAG TPA: potassium channel family protein [Candidatus Dormibacteraeota bacterium]|jgi:voltage-gated potassium channel|nr:potassium channel family protein [Candidatus Dormibacteraeota bacterium]
MIAGHPERNPLGGFLRALLVLAVVIVYGTVGYVAIEHYSFLDAVFMTVITITTVGFEEVHPLDSAGEVFTITLIVFGVAGFLYTFGIIVEQLSSGHLQSFRRYRRMDAQLRSLRDHYIVCGYGRTGTQVVREIEQAGRHYVVVEMNSAPLEDVRKDERLCVIGDAANDEVLQLAGIDRARALVSAVDSDERNVYIVLTARSLKPDLFIVARSSYPDSIAKLHRAGADRVVSPYTTSGRRMAALALQPAVVDVLDRVFTEGGEMTVEELVVPEGAGEHEVAELQRSGASLLAVRTSAGHLSVRPGDAERVGTGDLIVALGSPAQLAALASTVAGGTHSG